jgi:hypothetical protein
MFQGRNKGESMIITYKVTQEQLRKIHNLMMNCRNKQEMAEHLIDIGLNAFHAIYMSNSFKPLYEARSIVKTSFTVLPLIKGISPRTYEAGEYEPRTL